MHLSAESDKDLFEAAENFRKDKAPHENEAAEITGEAAADEVAVSNVATGIGDAIVNGKVPLVPAQQGMPVIRVGDNATEEEQKEDPRDKGRIKGQRFAAVR